MKLKDITVNNFRGIRSLHLPMDTLTVLIGENNTGKSTVLEALRLVLTRGFGYRKDSIFTEYDFHLKDAEATPHTAEPISIRLHFAESVPNEWVDAITQQLNEIIQLDAANGLNHIWLEVCGNFQPLTQSFETTCVFLNANNEELTPRITNLHNTLVKFVPLFLLSALRDASKEFNDRGQFWKSFLKSIDIPADEQIRLEAMLQEVNSSVIDANEGLTAVKNKMAESSRLVPLLPHEPVALEAIPTRVFDMVGKVQVHLKSPNGAKLPLLRHGEGTQSLAVLMLFQAFVESNLKDIYAPESAPLLALEEPEAHLHPSAIRTLGAFLAEMTGQTLVTSHSGDLVSRVELTSLRRLYKQQDGETKVGQVLQGLLDANEMRSFDHHIRLNKGHYLFSRCWLLVEGASDFHIMQLLFDFLGHSQDELSFSILEISQVADKGEPFFKIAHALGIEWFLIADGDSDGHKYVERAKNYIIDGEHISNRANNLANLTIEHEFWFNDFKTFFENTTTTNQKREAKASSSGDVNKEIQSIIKGAIKTAGGKPAFAQVLVDEVKRRGVDSIPQSIRNVITRIVQLAGR